MTQITELKNLRVRAIAVQVPEDAHDFYFDKAFDAVFYTLDKEPFYGAGHRFRVDLPNEWWLILGRANELDARDFLKMLFGEDYIFADGPLYGKVEIEWQSYCTANNLTNQLILIQE